MFCISCNFIKTVQELFLCNGMCGEFLVDEELSSSESFQGVESFPHIRLERNNFNTSCGTVEDLQKIFQLTGNCCRALKNRNGLMRQFFGLHNFSKYSIGVEQFQYFL